MSATLVCPWCGTRWKILPLGSGDEEASCPVCEEDCGYDGHDGCNAEPCRCLEGVERSGPRNAG